MNGRLTKSNGDVTSWYTVDRVDLCKPWMGALVHNILVLQSWWENRLTSYKIGWLKGVQGESVFNVCGVEKARTCWFVDDVHVSCDIYIYIFECVFIYIYKYIYLHVYIYLQHSTASIHTCIHLTRLLYIQFNQWCQMWRLGSWESQDAIRSHFPYK